MRDIPTFKQHKLDYGETLVQISDHPLCDIAKVVIKDGNKLLNLIKCFVTFNKKTVQLKIDTKAGVANVTDGKDGDFTGTPWKIIRSFQMGSVREDVVDQALNFIQGLVKPIDESEKGLKEAIELLESAGYVCERYRGDNYVFDHLNSVDVPGFVHSREGDVAHTFDADEFQGYEGQMRIYSNFAGDLFDAWIQLEGMDKPLHKDGEVPDFFWKKSSYSGGEDSRVSHWIAREMRMLLRQTKAFAKIQDRD
jgi:hypothetical protein